LLSLTSKADIAERLPEMMGEHPVSEDALVDLAHLPGTGDHPTAVDHGWHPEPRAVLLDQELGRQLGGAIESASPAHWESLGIPRRGDTGDALFGGDLEPGWSLLQVQSSLRRHWVDAAGREEYNKGTVAPGQLEAVVGTGQIGVEEIARVTIDTAHHRGLGGA